MSTVRVLNVAEKPSVAREISRVLCGQPYTRPSRSRYNPIHEFDTQINGTQCHMLFTSVSGHLMEVDFHPPISWSSSDVASLFTAPIAAEITAASKLIEETLRRECVTCQWLILWTDCDREGENIAFEIRDVCLQSNRRLMVKRARFSALTATDITRALSALTEPNANFSDAVAARQEIDLRIGAVFTRFQTLRLQRLFPQLAQNTDNERSKLISYGPCQFPTLGFVVDRYLQRTRFIPETFWTITFSYAAGADHVAFHWSRGRLYDRLCTVILYEMCVEARTATITSVQTSSRTKQRPFPLTTVEMQRRLAGGFARLSSDRTMFIAEKLYQRGIISYPRTETDVFHDESGLRALIEQQSHDPQWGAYAQRLLNGEFASPLNGGHDDKAHPPIHPTRYDATLTGDEKVVYNYIVRHFLAACSADAIGESTNVACTIGIESFTASGLVVRSRNYLDIFPFDRWSSHTIPAMSVGQEFDPINLIMKQSATEPPPLLTEPDLITLMDSRGIGTDATISQHITTIKTRCYVYVENDHLVPTPLGLGLVCGYDEMNLALSQPNLRAHMEKELKAVADGHKTKVSVVHDVLDDMKRLFADVRDQASKLDQQVGHYLNQIGADEMMRRARQEQAQRQNENRQAFHSGGDGGGSAIAAGNRRAPREARSSNHSSAGYTSSDRRPAPSAAVSTTATATCYQCNRIGHYASSCPDRSASNTSNARSYQSNSNWNQRPASAENRINSNGGGMNNSVCFACQQPGHYANSCPNRQR